MRNRFRYCYGETHDGSMVADDVKRKYIHSGLTLVDMMNEYDIKCNLMEEELEKLGYKLVFIVQEFNMESKKFELSYTVNPSPTDNGDWKIVNKEEFESIKLKGD